MKMDKFFVFGKTKLSVVCHLKVKLNKMPN